MEDADTLDIVGVLFYTFFFLQAQSDDDEVGSDDVAVTVEGRDGEFMNQFFQEVIFAKLTI